MRCRHVLDRLNVAAACNAAHKDRTARKRAARHTAMLAKKADDGPPRGPSSDYVRPMPDGDTTALGIARQLARPAATALGLQTDPSQS